MFDNTLFLSLYNVFSFFDGRLELSIAKLSSNKPGLSFVMTRFLYITLHATLLQEAGLLSFVSCDNAILNPRKLLNNKIKKPARRRIL